MMSPGSGLPDRCLRPRRLGCVGRRSDARRYHPARILVATHAAAEAFKGSVSLQDGARFRRVRAVRDYGMFDRREAPQYYPDVKDLRPAQP